MDKVSHLPNSAHVLVLSCCSVFAVTIMVAPNLVESIHKIIQETNADFPIPRPEPTANLNISGKSMASFFLIWFSISRKIFSCHLRGPVKCSRGVSFSPQGKTNLTKFNGSSLMLSDQTAVINSLSWLIGYFIFQKN